MADILFCVFQLCELFHVRVFVSNTVSLLASKRGSGPEMAACVSFVIKLCLGERERVGMKRKRGRLRERDEEGLIYESAINWFGLSS